MDAASKAQQLLWTSPSHVRGSRVSLLRRAGASRLLRLRTGRRATAAHRRCRCASWATAVWAENCPENFENRAALVGAEIARIEGRELDAERLYELAIRSARANGFVHNEAIAYEWPRASTRRAGFDQIADVYLRNARYGYLRWGADGKVRQLDQHYPHLRREQDSASSTATIGTPVAQLNVETIVRASTSAVERNCAAQANRDAHAAHG